MPIRQEHFRQSQQVPVKVWTDNVAHNSIDQLCNTASLKIIHSHVAAMPDVHLGKGATVGSVFATKGAIIPAAVGVDIGCGMVAARLSVKAHQLPDSLKAARTRIEQVVPLGPGGAHKRAMISAQHPITQKFDQLIGKYEGLARLRNDKFATQAGTLGSGNHFIELCIDENDDVWVMLHSGSRGPGNVVGSFFIEQAKQQMGDELGSLPDRDLAYLTENTEAYVDYCFAVNTMQEYAAYNREVMFDLVIGALRQYLPEFTITKDAVNTHHNYVNKETHYGADVWVTRKGAISAQKDELGIIPGSMGSRSYIVRGKGNCEAFCSAPHGAGRVHSRGEAKRLFTVEDLKTATEGIECRKDAGVIDEIPHAYKNIDEVIDNSSDLVEVLHTLRQVLNVKG
jgi:tRNA-splicing ligase RtcB